MNIMCRWICFAILCCSLPSGALAQNYPNKPVRLVVPYPPGGVVDISGRQLAQELTRQLGVQIVVDNRVGAGGTIGAAQVAKATADGYTLLFSGAGTHAFAPWVYKKLAYDPVKDFVPVTQLSEGPLALCVLSSSPVKTLDDFVKLLRAEGSKINYASNGSGTYPHLSVELMAQALGVKPVHVPYAGGAQALNALLGGEVQFTLNHIPVVQGQVKSGRVRVIATTGTSRSKTYPDVPTLKESGMDIVASAWFGLFAPAGTPAAIVDRLYKASAVAAESASFKERLAAQGDEVLVEGPERFSSFQAAELQKWRPIIQKAGIQAN
jgi:tripartite-type tricarboxylate transporter receptor subunit TctC